MVYEKEVMVLVRFVMSEDDGTFPFSDTMTFDSPAFAKFAEAEVDAQAQKRYDDWRQQQKNEMQTKVVTMLQDKSRIEAALAKVTPEDLAAAIAVAVAPDEKDIPKDKAGASEIVEAVLDINSQTEKE